MSVSRRYLCPFCGHKGRVCCQEKLQAKRICNQCGFDANLDKEHNAKVLANYEAKFAAEQSRITRFREVAARPEAAG